MSACYIHMTFSIPYGPQDLAVPRHSIPKHLNIRPSMLPRCIHYPNLNGHKRQPSIVSQRTLNTDTSARQVESWRQIRLHLRISDDRGCVQVTSESYALSPLEISTVGVWNKDARQNFNKRLKPLVDVCNWVFRIPWKGHWNSSLIRTSKGSPCIGALALLCLLNFNKVHLLRMYKFLFDQRSREKPILSLDKSIIDKTDRIIVTRHTTKPKPKIERQEP